MASKLNNGRIATKQEKKIVKAIADGANVAEVAKSKSLDLGLTERQVYSEVDRLKLAYNCLTLPHLIATFIRSKIIN